MSFQEFFYINESVFSEMQDVWDRYKDSTHINLNCKAVLYIHLCTAFLKMHVNHYTDEQTET